MSSHFRTYLFALLCLLLSLPGLALADIISTVDSTDIDEMQSVQLTVRITGTNQVDDFDLSPLEQDFEITNSTTQSQFRSVNGRVSSWVEYHIALRPLRTGTLTVPALVWRTERSEPIEVRVRPVSDTVRQEIDRLVYFEVSLNKPTVYVQAQAVLTRRLYYTVGVQIYGDLPGAPDLPDAVVLPLGEATSEATMLGSRRYGVLEQRYAIFPERSGTLEIPGFSVTSSVRLADRGRRGVRVLAEAQTLQVLPVPDSYPAHLPWFPAEDVRLAERWQPDKLRLRAGESLTREIRVVAKGAVGSGIPPVEVTLPESHFKQYARPPAISDEASGRTTTGERTQTYDLIVTHGGQVSTPPVSVTWWDTSADALRTSTLEPRALMLIGELPSTSAQEERTDHARTTDIEQMPADASPVASVSPPWWIWPLNGALAGLVLLALLFARRRERRVNPMKAARAAIQSAATVGALQEALLSYASRRWQVPRSQAADAIRERTHEGADLLDRLNRAGYSAERVPPSTFEASCLALLKDMKQPDASSKNQRRNTLPPLYPA